MLKMLKLNNFMIFGESIFDFSSGLNIITGETGAGKSTILTALSLVFGGRGQTDYIRKNQEQSTLTALFECHNHTAIHDLCASHDIPCDGVLIIRRILHIKRPSVAYINDVAVTMQFLNKISEYCAEICGQFEDRVALSPAGFRNIIDGYISDKSVLKQVQNDFDVLKNIQNLYETEKKALASGLKEQDYLRHVLSELDALSPKRGEEDALAGVRQSMMAIDKNMSVFHNVEQSLLYDGAVESVLLNAIKSLSQLEKDFPDSLTGILNDLNEALEKASGATQNLSAFIAGLSYNPQTLSDAEERLFALRAAARKHHVTADELYDLHREFSEKLDKIDNSEAFLNKLEKQLHDADINYRQSAMILGKLRRDAAPALETMMLNHLSDLGLSAAEFRIRFEDTVPQKDGMDNVIFEMSTGPGMPFGAIHKTASGGEMSRFMLALKAASVQDNKNIILIFDEIDRGVGGATAESVGNKLKNLSENVPQVIVITHSPQVAAKGDTHFHISKTHNADMTTSQVRLLDKNQRREEIARMLSGLNVTSQARAAADNLLENI